MPDVNTACPAHLDDSSTALMIGIIVSIFIVGIFFRSPVSAFLPFLMFIFSYKGSINKSQQAHIISMEKSYSSKISMLVGVVEYINNAPSVTITMITMTFFLLFKTTWAAFISIVRSIIRLLQ